MLVRRLLATTVAALAMLGGLLPLTAAPAQAAAVIDFSESFTGTTLTNPGNWAAYRYQEYGSSAPCLTASFWGTEIPVGVGDLYGCGGERVGQGALRLMENQPRMSATLMYTQPLPTANGMDITFRMGAYGSGTGPVADGISFFVKKGDNPDDVPGYRGGSLSYAPNLEYGEPGLPGALLGIGFDLYGTWSSNEAGGTGCATRGVGYPRNSIAIRGPGQGTTGYCYLGGTGSSAFSWYNSSSRDRAAKDVRIVIDSADVPNPRVSVYVGLPGAISSTPIVSVPLPKEFLTQPTFKFGFGGATGGLYTKADVWNLKIKAVEPNPPTGIAAAWAGPSGGKETAAVTWVEPTSGPPPTSYIAYAKRGATVAGTCTAPAGTTTCTITGLDTTDYDITVVTVSGDEKSPPSAPVRIVLAPVSITSATPLPGGTVGTHYAQPLAATGGNGPYTWTVASGSLPAGVTLDADGTLSGLPTASGTASFSLTATDSKGRTATKAFTLPVVEPLLITTSSLPNGATGVPYSTTLAATGGTTYTWSLVSGPLPAGLTLNSAGTISGNPSAGGAFTITVRVTDENSRTDERVLAIGIDQTPPVQVTTTTVPSGVEDEAYLAPLEATGGIGPYTWSIVSGSLPSGVSLVGGVLTGTPTVTASFPITVRATDSSAGTPLTDDQALTLVVYAPVQVTTASLDSSAPGAAYSETLAATGGDGTYTWSVTGDLPAGLSLNPATGEISGTVAASALVGDYPITVHAEDGTGSIASRELVLTLTSPVTVVTTALPSGGTDLAYGATLVADGGTGPYTWTLESGSLPSGLSLGADGEITGTPSAAVTRSVTVKATDSYGATATRTLSLTINQTPPPVISISPAAQSVGGVRGKLLAPTATYVETGFENPPTYTIAPALPAGLVIDPATGVVSGTPTTTSAARTYTVTATGPGGRSATATISIVVNAPEPDGYQIAPATQTVSLTAWTAMRPTVEMSAYGFTGPVTYSVSPALPAGLSINPGTGSISGSPRVAVSGTWTITGSDGTDSDTATVTLRITAKAQVASPAVALPAALATPGCTVIVPGSVTTNAGQTATVSVTAGVTTAGDQRPAYRVVRGSAGKVSICTSGYRSATLTVRLSAPAVPGYTSYSQAKVYTVREVR